MAEMLIKHEAKTSALLASRPCTECFISRKAQAKQCFYYFQKSALIKMCLLLHCTAVRNLHGASLFIFMSYNYVQAYASQCFLIAKLASYQIMFSLIYK